MIAILLRFFGYVKIPQSVVEATMWIRGEASRKNPDMERINNMAEALEKFFRSGRM